MADESCLTRDRPIELSTLSNTLETYAEGFGDFLLRKNLKRNEGGDEFIKRRRRATFRN
ncbi:hypothetical protein DY000_02039134 [Brassica cretica]|uniref:Uncharacterized protein n=1 Tax=Brassica cretica TaxID=69181 RepID=A0ABQ7BHC5_BRACR|nr:hypothetical protein DY000_02039134 [Brassica cretica]